jgi:hypothetical protein
MSILVRWYVRGIKCAVVLIFGKLMFILLNVYSLHSYIFK